MTPAALPPPSCAHRSRGRLLQRGDAGKAQLFGGSHAQRDLVDQTLIAAAERSGRQGLARALLRERQLLAEQRRMQ